MRASDPRSSPREPPSRSWVLALHFRGPVRTRVPFAAGGLALVAPRGAFSAGAILRPPPSLRTRTAGQRLSRGPGRSDPGSTVPPGCRLVGGGARRSSLRRRGARPVRRARVRRRVRRGSPTGSTIDAIAGRRGGARGDAAAGRGRERRAARTSQPARHGRPPGRGTDGARARRRRSRRGGGGVGRRRRRSRGARARSTGRRRLARGRRGPLALVAVEGLHPSRPPERGAGR
jgi:hypothetical protein